MISEDRTHLEWLQTSPSQLANLHPKDEVPQADGRYLMETQVRRAKPFLRPLTHFTCPTVAQLLHQEKGWAVPHFPPTRKLGEQGPDGEEEHADSFHLSTQGEQAGLAHAPSGLDGRSCSKVVLALGSHHATRHQATS